MLAILRPANSSEKKRNRRRNTHNKNHIRITRLHLRSRRRILIPNKILRIDDRNDRIQLQIAPRLPLELADLERERGGERRAAALDEYAVGSVFVWSGGERLRIRLGIERTRSLPRISSKAFCIWPTRTQHLSYFRQGGERAREWQPTCSHSVSR